MSVLFSASLFAEKFRELNIANIAVVDVPSDWHERDAEHRSRVTRLSEKLMDGTTQDGKQHVASHIVVSHKRNHDGLIRASVVPIDNVTQHELQTEYYLDHEGLLEDVRSFYVSEHEVLKETMRKTGQRLGDPSVYFTWVDGFLAFAYAYQRAFSAPDSIFVATQVHIPNGSIKLVFTFSYRKSRETTIKPVLEEVLQSIRFL